MIKDTKPTGYKAHWQGNNTLITQYPRLGNVHISLAVKANYLACCTASTQR